ncbi:MAG TPA: CotH kinase family protein [Candidatus Paceibacterota bacterium]|nr:CotH kinase family protein [Candidatus Paceibacterota bacterium]
MRHKMRLLLSLTVVLAFVPTRLAAAEELILSEFMAANSTSLADEDGEYSDWIEIYNAGEQAVNLAGWWLTDDTNNLSRWQFPATNLNPHAFLVVFSSGKDRRAAGAPLHTSFGLSREGEYLALVKPDGQTVASELWPAYPAQYPDISYGTGQSTVLIASNAPVRIRIPDDDSLGLAWTSPAFNDSAWTAGTNGVGFETVVPGFAVRTVKAAGMVSSLSEAEQVLASPALQAAVFTANTRVINFFNSGGDGYYFDNESFPGLNPNEDVEDFVVEATATLTIPAAGQWTFGVNSDDGFGLKIGSYEMAYPDPRGPGDTLATFNVPAAGTYPLRLVFYERGGGSELEFWGAKGAFSFWNESSFRLIGDTAQGGLAVASTPMTGGLGSGYRSDIRTDAQSQMLNRRSSAQIRLPFQVTNPTAKGSLSLKIKYDDGFVAYLNGVEVARRNAPATPTWNSTATSSHSGRDWEIIDLTVHRAELREGANVFAIQGFNEALAGGDFLILAELVAFQSEGVAYGYFAPATPGQPNVTPRPAPATPVQFSMPGGIYTSNLVVSLFSSTPGAVIRYTLDNKIPMENSALYTAPLAISNSVAIRARAFVPGLTPSAPVTAIYTLLDLDTRSFSSRLPLVVVNAYGRSISPDMASLVDASLTVIDVSQPSGVATLVDPPDFHGRIGIEGRGQTSWGFPKKPYNVEIRDEDNQDRNASLLGMPAESDWVLLNTYNDKTFLNDFLAHELFEQMGHYAVRRRHVEVFLNGTRPEGGSDPSGKVGYNDYVGIYLLLEKIKIDEGRVDIAKLGPNDDTEPAITGGYIFKKDKDSPGDMGFSTSSGQYLKYHDPKGSELTSAQRNWLINHLNQFEAALYGAQWRNPATGYARYIDVDSFVDNHWIVEFTKQIDGYRLSNYLHKDRGGKIRIGPIWDWNLSFGNADYLTGEYTEGWYWSQISSGDHLWLRRLIAEPGDPDFNQKIIDRWSVLRTNVLSGTRVQARIDEMAALLNEAQARDFKRWPRLGSYVWPNPSGLANARTYAEVLAWVKNWVGRRFEWIDKQFVPAPVFSRAGGAIVPGESVALSAAQGTVYYSLDGTDPRATGGAPAPGAVIYSKPLPISSNARVFARARLNNNWSGPAVASFLTQIPPLAITELMYHPAPPALGDTNTVDDFQFIELKNVGSTPLDLTGIRFVRGIDFTFAGGVLAPGQRMVLVKNPTAFQSRYGASIAIGGVFTNSLARNGERLTLVGRWDEPILDFTYDNDWNLTTDGYGFSLVIVNEMAAFDTWQDPQSWGPSTLIGGSPGSIDIPSSIPPVVINEVLSHTAPPQLDSIELYNPGAQPADISYWRLTDDPRIPHKYTVSANTILPPGGYLVFDESHFDPNPGIDPGFSLSAQGDEVFLFSANAAGNLTGYSDGFRFGAAAVGVTFGRYTNSVGDIQYPAQREATWGAVNSGPRVGPVVLNEIHYYPASNQAEFIELKNITDAAVKCFDPIHPSNTWRIAGVDFAFPTNVVIPARGFLLVTAMDPALFRAQNNVPIQVTILGPYAGQLQDNGELIELQQPDTPVFETHGMTSVPWVTIDAVRYDSTDPWPVHAAGQGSSLERIRSDAYGNDPANWRASMGIASPGWENQGNRPPLVDAGPDQQLESARFPVVMLLQGTAIDDALPEPGILTLAWSQVSGPGTVMFADANQLNTSISVPGPGTFVLRLRASDGDLTAEDLIQVVLTRPPAKRTIIPTAAEWKYLDNGSDQGTAWRQLGFDDRAWAAGRTQLGYGDGDETTILGYGPDAGNKFVTTYFRKTFSITNAAGIRESTLKIIRDDGFVAYLNGTEVFRDNLPAGDVSRSTWALNAISGEDESTFLTTPVNPAVFVEGANVLAVEMHQVNGTSSDLSFDLELDAVFTDIDPPILDMPAWEDSSGPAIRIRFLQQPGATHILQYRDSLNEDPWRELLQWPPTSNPQRIDVPDVIPEGVTHRYYRLVLE